MRSSTGTAHRHRCPFCCRNSRRPLDPRPSAIHPDQYVGTYTLLEAARKYWLADKGRLMAGAALPPYLHRRGLWVLGSRRSRVLRDHPYAPNSPYSATKAASDHLVRAYAHTYGLPGTISNCSNNYRPLHVPGETHPLMILNALPGCPCRFMGTAADPRLAVRRGPLRGHLDAFFCKGKPGETYCIGGDNQPTNLTVVNTLCEILDECLPELAVYAA